MYLDALFVKPDLQNNGYGSALLKKILAAVILKLDMIMSLPLFKSFLQADDKEQAVWLFSSKESNQSYYELFGFETVASVKLGDNNPEWLGEPVIVPLVSRDIQFTPLFVHGDPLPRWFVNQIQMKKLSAKSSSFHSLIIRNSILFPYDRKVISPESQLYYMTKSYYF